MTKPVIATPRKLPGALAGMLRAKYDVREPDGDFVFCLHEFAALAEGSEVVFATAFDDVNDAFLAALPGVRFIASIGAGYDHIDVDAARARGVMVSNTPTVTDDCVADTTIGLIIAACRRFREGLAIAVAGDPRGMQTPDSWGQRVTGRTLGIIGMGNIGKAVAKRARGFDMTVQFYGRRPQPDAERETGARQVGLDELLTTSDIVTLHCPLNRDTHHLIDAAALQKMKPTAVLVNMARGPVVDELALIEALKEKRLFAAGLDVFETEPGPIREELRSLSNAFCLPHIASATMESRSGMALRLLANIDAYFETGAPLDRVA
ncbi:MAG: D-glycerate dehydrogenase [Pseudomonadota bacterium]|nr:D-glycerate dehydrogenase [Pseudomonadota bacterium]